MANQMEKFEEAASKMDEDSSSDDLSDSSENEDESVIQKKLLDVKEKIASNPYHYDSHLELINLCRQLGELDSLRDAREKMSRLFPLTPELWLDWLTDEVKFAGDEERERVRVLFKKAVQDYISVPLWLEYAQFSIGDMGKKDGIENVRDIFDQALTACGIHVTQGSLVWEAYREFELAILTTLQPSGDSTISSEQEEMLTQQRNRILNLFRRQLSVPLIDMERTYEELKEFTEGQFDSSVQNSYEKTQKKLEKLQTFEDSLLSSESPHLEEYKNYIAFEEKEGDPTRIQCTYERAIADNCLVPELWQMYTTFLDHRLKIDYISLPVHERALRNCPWNSTLWVNYIRALERYQQPHEKTKEAFEQALASGLSQSEDFRLLWLAYLDYLRRRVKWDKAEAKEIDELRNTFQKAVDHLYQSFGADGDPTCSILRYWAKVEAKFCKNMSQARELWNNIMNQGQASKAQMWLEYANLERAFGDDKHLRKVLMRGLHSASDYPESVGDALITFEREEGTLENLDLATEKYDIQINRVNEIRKKKESALQRQEETRKADRKFAKQGKKASKLVETTNFSQKRKLPSTEGGSGEKKAKVDSEGFKIPPLPMGSKRESVEERVPDAAASEKGKGEPSASVTVMKHDSSKDHRTAFLSNIAYHVEEDRIKEIFSRFGEITEIRLVKNFRGKSKGYCYVEYSNEDSTREALANDRMLVDGRPVFISRCEDKKNKGPVGGPKFKFSQGLEKNKLFIKNLPTSTTEKDLEEIFGKHGMLKQVRLVTYRNGHSKGLAYVDYEDQASANAALMKTDGMQMEGNTISVAYSNPPQRKEKRDETSSSQLAQALGAGTKETGPRGRGRQQVSLIPRSVQRVPQEPEKSEDMQNGVKNGSHEEKAMTNDDFRSMLLK